MKTKIYSILLFSLILACAQIIACKKSNGCDPNNPPAGGTIDIAQEDKLVLFPYKDFDTMKFVKNNSDTILFLGGKIETGYSSQLDNNFDCPHLDKIQFMTLTFTNNLYGNIVMYENNIHYSISFNNRTYGPVNNGFVYFYKDTTNISIRGVAYQNVYRFNGSSTTDNLYFRPSIGIIKIIYKGDTYEKLP